MHPFPEHIKPCEIMMFIDGENLAIRWRKLLADREPPAHVTWEKDVFVWSKYLNMKHHIHCNVTRKHYYTSAPGDADNQNRLFDALKSFDIEAPHVFPKTKSKGSKRVDITLSVDMLTHGFYKNYDAAVLVAGDEDYVPLVEAVKNAGRRVFIWFVESGLSPKLKRSSDYYFDLGNVLFNANVDRHLSG